MRWSARLAYAVGLITTDGCLSKDGRHIDLTSKDISQLQTFARILRLKNRIGLKTSTYNPSGTYYRIQFGNVKFYRFLNRIGLYSNKSRTIGPLKIPAKYFADFLRGNLDGDGNISVVTHPESQYPQLRMRFISGSSQYLDWMKECICKYFNISGGFINKSYDSKNVYILNFAKTDSIKILESIYYNGVQYYLKRKFDSAQEILAQVMKRYTCRI